MIPPEVEEFLAGAPNTTNGRRYPYLSRLIQRTNHSFERSGIPHRLYLEVDEVDYPYDNDLSFVEEVLDEMWDRTEVTDARDDSGADIVIVLTDHTWTKGESLDGLASEYGPDIDKAMAMVRIRETFGLVDVFSHEIGHIFGCYHDAASINPKDPDDVCAHGWEVIEDKFYTIMHTFPLNYKNNTTGTFPKSFQIPNFSDPDIEYGGDPTGIADHPDFAQCAGRIRETGCEISVFEGPQEFVTIIEGETYFCSGTETYEAKVSTPPSGSPGQPPYTYTWSWSDDGIDFNLSGQILATNSTSNSINVPPPNIPSCDYIFLHVEVTSNDNIKSRATKRIGQYNCPGCAGPRSPIGPIVVKNNDLIEDECFEVETTYQGIKVVMPSTDEATIKIFNVAGNLLETRSIGLTSTILVGEELPSGVYILSVYGKDCYNSKIIRYAR